MAKRDLGRRTRVGRTAAGAGIVLAGLVGAAVPAWGHASFPGYSANGFQPNTSGGTGDVGSTPPYAGMTAVTMYLRAAGEQSQPYNGAPDSTVDVKVTVPAGWTSPTCGTAKLQVKDASTNNTNQPGADVAGWQCEVYTSGGHAVIHFWGPQVGPQQTIADSAQFWSFTVTTPGPAAQTTYDGTNGTEGFIATQQYASGAISYWIPNAAYPGNVPPGVTPEVASGLVRTVAAYVAPSTTTTSTTTSTTSTTVASTTSTTAPATAVAAVSATPVYTG